MAARLIKNLNAITLLILIVGGLNWALVGIFDFNALSIILGYARGDASAPLLATRVAYVVIGLSAVWQLGVLWTRLTPKGG